MMTVGGSSPPEAAVPSPRQVDLGYLRKQTRQRQASEQVSFLRSSRLCSVALLSLSPGTNCDLEASDEIKSWCLSQPHKASSDKWSPESSIGRKEHAPQHLSCEQEPLNKRRDVKADKLRSQKHSLSEAPATR